MLPPGSICLKECISVSFQGWWSSREYLARAQLTQNTQKFIWKQTLKLKMMIGRGQFLGGHHCQNYFCIWFSLFILYWSLLAHDALLPFISNKKYLVCLCCGGSVLATSVLLHFWHSAKKVQVPILVVPLKQIAKWLSTAHSQRCPVSGALPGELLQYLYR